MLTWELTWDFSTRRFVITFTESVSPAEVVRALNYLERKRFRRLTRHQPAASGSEQNEDQALPAARVMPSR